MNNENTEQALQASTLAVKNDKNGLLGQLHGLILFSIASTYYKDCLTLVFLLRTFSQIQIAIVGVRIVVTASVISFATHFFHSLPKAGKGGSNYGVFIDFIGEIKPSRIGLLSLDVLVFALQLLYLALLYKTPKTGTGEEAAGSEAQVAQDIEAEEQGISRRNPSREAEDGIELQSLLPDGSDHKDDAAEGEGNVIYIGKKDLIGVFTNTTAAARSTESADAVRRLLQRMSSGRTQETTTETTASTATPAAPAAPAALP